MQRGAEPRGVSLERRRWPLDSGRLLVLGLRGPRVRHAAQHQEAAEAGDDGAARGAVHVAALSDIRELPDAGLRARRVLPAQGAQGRRQRRRRAAGESDDPFLVEMRVHRRSATDACRFLWIAVDGRWTKDAVFRGVWMADGG